jgi:hypothetical protein
LHGAGHTSDVGGVHCGGGACSSDNSKTIASAVSVSAREGSAENRGGVGGQQDNTGITESSSSLKLSNGRNSAVGEVSISRDKDTGTVEGRDAPNGASNSAGGGVPVVGDGAAESSLLGSAERASAVSRDDHAKVKL